jgi:hypothetical protein
VSIKERISKVLWNSNIQDAPKKRRVHNFFIYQWILIIYTPDEMVVYRLYKDLINSHIALSASRLNCQNIFFQIGTHTFFNNSDRDFYSENNNVSQIATYIPKIQKKK